MTTNSYIFNQLTNGRHSTNLQQKDENEKKKQLTIETVSTEMCKTSCSSSMLYKKQYHSPFRNTQSSTYLAALHKHMYN